ncbi:hypothetical protein PJ985_10335 [Streptomyces sp. ACA25]|uniref:hypothetical protein n=1 Tax=Streptomyces sp. ACA25 TaxID=3022596 RepID=UPI002307360B|nr:hypothetical protein [Streptomyces sp. ACA25]MDB1087963.1 hypothetical protein [Streptomyces sp. ACA25]
MHPAPPPPPPQPSAGVFAVPPPQEVAPPGRPPRRWGRTTALLATALLLGITGGTAVGYTVQADRDPTPLPPLARTGLADPGEALSGQAQPAPLPEDADRWAGADGDLRELLVGAPEGATDWDIPQGANGWMDLGEFSANFVEPAEAFFWNLEREVRRVAVVSWNDQDGRSVLVKLIQFREEANVVAPQYLGNGRDSMHGEGRRGTALPGEVNAWTYRWHETFEEPGYLPYTEYHGRALAQRGDVVMDIWMLSYDEDPAAFLVDLAEQQLERL